MGVTLHIRTPLMFYRPTGNTSFLKVRNRHLDTGTVGRSRVLIVVESQEWAGGNEEGS